MSDTTAISAPIALHTAPSGKVTKWGAPGTDQVFKNKSDAQSFISGQAVNEAAKAEDKGPHEIAAERRAESYAKARENGDETAPAEAPEPPAPKAGVKAAPVAGLKIADLLPAGATTEAPKSGAYYRVMIYGKSIGYISPRKGGALLAEVLTSKLGKATPGQLEGTTARQNQTALLVDTKVKADQAHALFSLAAQAVAPKEVA